jgi:hypothetical protein
MLTPIVFISKIFQPLSGGLEEFFIASRFSQVFDFRSVVGDALEISQYVFIFHM